MNNNFKLQITVGLAAKVGSILTHVEEGCGIDGHSFDWQQVYNLIQDKEVQEWLNGLRKDALVPVKRN